MRGDTVSGYGVAINIFRKISDWKDADEQIALCQNRIEEIKAKEEADHLEAERLAEKKRIEKEKNAKKRKKVLAVIAALTAVCVAVAVLVVEVILPKQNLNKALALLDSGNYDEAYALLDEIGNQEIIESSIRDRANESLNAGEYDIAYSLFERIGDTESVSNSKYNRAMTMIESGDYNNALAVFKTLSGYKDSNQKIEICENAINDAIYNNAVDMFNSGDIINAYKCFEKLMDYKDSKQKANDIYNQYKTTFIKSVEVGDCFGFGRYEQDGNNTNGTEEIKWLVLVKENNKMLVISKRALDCQPYNTDSSFLKWETCSLRKWLNESFYINAFDSDEQKVISFNEQNDKLFILSTKEANDYFISDDNRVCQGTEYCFKQGALNKSNLCSWLLRATTNMNYVNYVDNYGRVRQSAFDEVNGTTAVRPAMWIDLGE